MAEPGRKAEDPPAPVARERDKQREPEPLPVQARAHDARDSEQAPPHGGVAPAPRSALPPSAERERLLRMQQTYGNGAVVRHRAAQRGKQGQDKPESEEDVNAAMRALHRARVDAVQKRPAPLPPKRKPFSKRERAKVPLAARKRGERPRTQRHARRFRPDRAGVRPRPAAGGAATRVVLPSLPMLPELAPFRAHVGKTWRALYADAEAVKARIRVGALLHAAATVREMLAQAADVDQGYADAIALVDKTSMARDHVDGERRTKKEAAANVEREQRARLDKVFVDQAKAMRQAANDKSKLMSDLADAEGARARSECAKKAGRAWRTLAGKLPKYKDYDRKDRIEVVLQEMTAATADSITKAGADIDTSVHQDASDASKAFRDQASDSADNIEDGKDDARKQLDDNARGIGEVIDQIADGAMPQLADVRQKTMDDLAQQRASVVPSMRASTLTVLPVIVGAGEQACALVDQATNARARQLSHASVRAGRYLKVLRGKMLDQATQDAEAELDGALDAHAHNLRTLEASAEKSVVDNGTALTTKLGTSCAAIVSATASVAKQAVTGVTKIENDAVTQIDKVQKDTADKIKGGVDKVEADLKQRVADSAAKWQEEVDASKPKMKQKVDDALDTQEKAVSDLGQQLEDKAEKIENESWLSRTLHSIAGALVGLLEAIGDLLLGILKVLGWVLLAIVVIVVALLLLALLLPELAAAIAIALVGAVIAVAGFVIANAAIIGFIAAAVVIGVAIYRLYKSESVKGLSDFDRWRGRGKFVGDVGTAVFGGKILGWLGKVGGRVGRWLGLFGEDAKATRAIAAFGGDEALMESAVGALGGDAARLDRLVAAAGGDAARLQSLVQATGGDWAQLERLIGMSGNDAGKLEGLLRAAGGDVGRVERALAQAEGDVAKAEQALQAPPEPTTTPAKTETTTTQPPAQGETTPTQPPATGESTTTPPPAQGEPTTTTPPAPTETTTTPPSTKGETTAQPPAQGEATATQPPAKGETTTTEPAAKTEPAKTEPAKTEPAKTEPAKTEPAKTEPAKTEPAKPKSAKEEPPPGFEKPKGRKPPRDTPEGDAWRYQRYKNQWWRRPGPKPPLKTAEEYADANFRGGRAGGPMQRGTRADLAANEGYTNTETTQLGTRVQDGKTVKNMVDMYKPGGATGGGTRYVEVDPMSNAGKPTPDMAAKLKAEMGALKPGEDLMFVDSNNSARRVVFRHGEDPAVVDTRTGPKVPRRPPRRTVDPDDE